MLGTVLLVDDEPIVLFVVQTSLEDAGWSVIAVSDGSEAMCLVHSRCSEIAALITDVGLRHGPNGWSVAAAARAKRPDLPVIYMSTSADQYAGEAVPQSVILPKPDVIPHLLSALEDLSCFAGRWE